MYIIWYNGHNSEMKSVTAKDRHTRMNPADVSISGKVIQFTRKKS